MKKILLKLAYGILKMYKEKPTNIELSSVILIHGHRFVITDCTIDIAQGKCPSVTIHGRWCGGIL